MGKGDRRNSQKSKQRDSQRKLKERQRKVLAAHLAKAPAAAKPVEKKRKAPKAPSAAAG